MKMNLYLELNILSKGIDSLNNLKPSLVLGMDVSYYLTYLCAQESLLFKSGHDITCLILSVFYLRPSVIFYQPKSGRIYVRSSARNGESMRLRCAGFLDGPYSPA